MSGNVILVDGQAFHKRCFRCCECKIDIEGFEYGQTSAGIICKNCQRILE